jgi:hypothetical protein
MPGLLGAAESRVGVTRVPGVGAGAGAGAGVGVARYSLLVKARRSASQPDAGHR